MSLGSRRERFSRLVLHAPYRAPGIIVAMTAPATRRTRRHPVLALVVLALAAVLVVVAVVQTRSSLTHTSPQSGMTLGSVRGAPAASKARVQLTVGYQVRSTPHTVTGEVDAASYVAQGRIVWVCFDPSDPGHAHLRLPTDDLCS